MSLARICSGQVALRHNGKTYFYSYPSSKVLYQANILEEDIINSDTNSMSKDEATELLSLTNKWSDSKQKEIEVEIPKLLENLKIQIYFSLLNKQNDYQTIKGKISKLKSYLLKLLSDKHSYDEYTIEGIARKEKTLFLLQKGIKGLDIEPSFLLSAFYSAQLNDSDYRKIARSNEWHLKLKAMKNGCHIFSKYLTEEQEELIRWSNVYSNLYEMEEPPSKEIIEDDDALDGFFLVKNMETKDKTVLAEIEARYSAKGKTYNELYLPAANMEQARRNDMLNTTEARRIKEARFKQIQEQGVVAEKDFADQRNSIMMAKNSLSMK
jgi:hypothetical protein